MTLLFSRAEGKMGSAVYFCEAKITLTPNFSGFGAILNLQQIELAGGSAAAGVKQKKLAALKQLLFLIRFSLPASGSVASGEEPQC